MYLLKKCIQYQSLNISLRLYSLARFNHYDVLKLRRNCSDKDIKEAFIQLSKKYHPDRNKDAKAQERFVQIVEAYNVLGKPSSRARYDNKTEINASTYSNPYAYRTRDYYNTNAPPNYEYYYKTSNSKAKNESINENTYYGFSNLKKVPNFYIICLCAGVVLIGVIFQVYIIRNLYVIQRSKAQEKSKMLAEELDRIRSAASNNGTELQTRLLLEKIVTGANPTITTASLGQALAKEKKEHSDALLSEFGIGEQTEPWDDNNQKNFLQSWDKIKFTYECW